MLQLIAVTPEQALFLVLDSVLFPCCSLETKPVSIYHYRVLSDRVSDSSEAGDGHGLPSPEEVQPGTESGLETGTDDTEGGGCVFKLAIKRKLRRTVFFKSLTLWRKEGKF